MAGDGATDLRNLPALVLAVAAAAVVLALALGANSSLGAEKAPCPNAGAKPHEVSLAKLRRSLTCLINRERHSRGRQRLERNRKLERAAKQHTDVMLAQDCFEHRCADEKGFSRRVRRTGYTRGWKAWAIAENLGFDDTPRSMFKRFLHKRFDRRNMLKPKFEDIGVGVAWGVPVEGLDDSKFATYTVVFGWRQH